MVVKLLPNQLNGITTTRIIFITGNALWILLGLLKLIMTSFRIPSVDELESDTSKLKVKDAFKKFQDLKDTRNQKEDNPNKGAVTTSTRVPTMEKESCKDMSVVLEESNNDPKKDQEKDEEFVDVPHCRSQSSDVAVLENIAKPNFSKGVLTVNHRQRGNAVLKHLTNIAWEYDEMVADFIMGTTTCGLFLSLRYHQLHQDYIYDRLKKLAHSFSLRVLFVLVDITDPHYLLKELGKICLLTQFSLMVGWSAEEVARHIETYKMLEHKSPELIMEKAETTFMGQAVDCLTEVRKINKSDAQILLLQYGDIASLMQASEKEMSLCPGIGVLKARRLYEAFHEPFKKSRKK